jgi:hypothetical protein
VPREDRHEGFSSVGFFIVHALPSVHPRPDAVQRKWCSASSFSHFQNGIESDCEYLLMPANCGTQVQLSGAKWVLGRKCERGGEKIQSKNDVIIRRVSPRCCPVQWSSGVGMKIPARLASVGGQGACIPRALKAENGTSTTVRHLFVREEEEQPCRSQITSSYTVPRRRCRRGPKFPLVTRKESNMSLLDNYLGSVKGASTNALDRVVVLGRST